MATTQSGFDYKRNESTLFDWILVYSAAVLLMHLIVDLLVVLFWPASSPFDCWSIIVGISTAGLVAVLAGVVTIVVSWYTSQSFGRETQVGFVTELRQALATSISSSLQLSLSVREILLLANDDTDSIVVILLQDQAIAPSGELSKEIAQLIAFRFERDLPTILAISPPPWILEGSVPNPVPAIWTSLASAANASDFRTKFSHRRSFILPVCEPRGTLAACLSSLTKSLESDFKVAFWAEAAGSVVGARSNIDREFVLAVVSKFCDTLEEPTDTYDRARITANDILGGKLTGIAVTRSIITSQLLLGAQKSLENVPAVSGGGRYIDVASVDPADGRRQPMLYAADMFLPPLQSDKNHSGSILAAYIENQSIDVRNKGVLEIGSGPGYLTKSISEQSGSGFVIANDISAKSIELARQNVLAEFQSSVHFLCADCLMLSFLAENSNGVDKLSVRSPGGDKWLVDIVLVELPLLPYRGQRLLSDFETSYLETSTLPNACLLPPTIRSVLEKLSPEIAKCNAEIVLPVCAIDSQELREVLEEVQSIVGSGCFVTQVGSKNDEGFLHCLAIKRL